MGANNNASPVVGQGNKNVLDAEADDGVFTISDPNAVDSNDHYKGDGFDVELHPNENESDFYSESDFEEMDQETTEDVGDDQRNDPPEVRVGSSKDKEPQDTGLDEFNLLFENEKVRNLFNKMLDKKVEAKLKEHSGNGLGKSGNRGKVKGKAKPTVTGNVTKVNNNEKQLVLPQLKSLLCMCQLSTELLIVEM